MVLFLQKPHLYPPKKNFARTKKNHNFASPFPPEGLFAVSSTVFAQSTEWVYENPGKSSQWSKSESLVYEKTLNGETWYNPGYPTVKGEIKDEWRIYKKFNIKPQSYDDSWSFELPIRNLNNEKESYFNSATPSKTIRRSDIVWGFGVGLLVDQDTFHIMVLIRRVDTVYHDGSKGLVHRFTVYDGNHWSEWRNSNSYDGETLYIGAYANSTTLSWGRRYSYEGYILSFPKHCDGITYVEFEVLPQSKLIVGDAQLKYKIIEKEQYVPDSQRIGNKTKLTKTESKPVLTK